MKNEGINITYEEALDILLQIPEDKFITGAYEQEKDNCCSIGHLSKILFNNSSPRANISNINNVFLHEQEIYIRQSAPGESLISQINDGRAVDYFHWKYNQNTAKQRVLAYLLDVVRVGKGNVILFTYD
ncbi:MAG: hypothetical protein ACK53T_07910 [Planctomycetota bacterium]|jgi:hypothetical protein